MQLLAPHVYRSAALLGLICSTHMQCANTPVFFPGIPCPAVSISFSCSCADLLLQVAKKHLPVSVETCAHYLNFAAEDIPEGDTRYKCAPPLRDAANRKGLIKGIQQYSIDIVSSDHSPAPPGMKEMDSSNFLKAWGGISGEGWTRCCCCLWSTTTGGLLPVGMCHAASHGCAGALQASLHVASISPCVHPHRCWPQELAAGKSVCCCSHSLDGSACCLCLQVCSTCCRLHGLLCMIKVLTCSRSRTC